MADVEDYLALPLGDGEKRNLGEAIGRMLRPKKRPEYGAITFRDDEFDKIIHIISTSQASAGPSQAEGCGYSLANAILSNLDAAGYVVTKKATDNG